MSELQPVMPANPFGATQVSVMGSRMPWRLCKVMDDAGDELSLASCYKGYDCKFVAFACPEQLLFFADPCLHNSTERAQINAVGR